MFFEWIWLLPSAPLVPRPSSLVPRSSSLVPLPSTLVPGSLLHGAFSAAVFFVNFMGVVAGDGGVAGGEDPLLSRFEGGFVVHNGGRVIASDATAEQILLQTAHAMRLGKVFVRDSFQFRHPFANEVAVGILVSGLASGRVDADGIDPGDSGLHLALAVVNAGFVVEEQSGEVQSGLSPVQPQMVGGK